MARYSLSKKTSFGLVSSIVLPLLCHHLAPHPGNKSPHLIFPFLFVGLLLSIVCCIYAVFSLHAEDGRRMDAAAALGLAVLMGFGAASLANLIAYYTINLL